MSFIIGIYIRSDAIIKHITINRKFSFVFSIIINETMSQIISFDILMTKNFIPASDFLYIYFLKIIKTLMFKIEISRIMIKLSIKFIPQK